MIKNQETLTKDLLVLQDNNQKKKNSKNSNLEENKKKLMFDNDKNLIIETESDKGTITGEISDSYDQKK